MAQRQPRTVPQDHHAVRSIRPRPSAARRTSARLGAPAALPAPAHAIAHTRHASAGAASVDLPFETGPAKCYLSPEERHDREGPMIVCVCNRLGDKQCRQMAGRPECRTVAGIYHGFQCRVRCGKCVPFMQEILRAQKESAPAELPDARPAPRP